MTLITANPQTKNNSLYEQDYYAWLTQMAELLTHRQLEQLDYENLIEEIESMGRQEKHSLASNLRVVIMHLLKYKYQSEKRSNSWLYTIFEHRERIRESLEDSPSLNSYITEIFDKCYQKARKEAALETGLNLNIFPVESPFTLTEILDEDFLP
jgi:predicted DNA-binding ribbon-helix-helix protein